MREGIRDGRRDLRRAARRVRDISRAGALLIVRALLIIGIILLILVGLSLIVPIPTRERHGFSAGGVSIGIETTQREKVHPAVSAVLIGGGVLLMIAGGRGRKR